MDHCYHCLRDDPDYKCLKCSEIVCLKCIPIHEAMYNSAIKHTEKYRVKEEDDF